MKIFIESIDQGIWGMQYWMDLTLLNMLLMINRLTSLGLSGQRIKEGKLNMTALQRTSSHHPWTWTSSLEFPNAKVPKKCGRCLKWRMKGLMMWREQGSMPWFKSMSYSRCNKDSPQRKYKRDSLTLSTISQV